jgi:hypothetical protein
MIQCRNIGPGNYGERCTLEAGHEGYHRGNGTSHGPGLGQIPSQEGNPDEGICPRPFEGLVSYVSNTRTIQNKASKLASQGK